MFEIYSWLDKKRLGVSKFTKSWKFRLFSNVRRSHAVEGEDSFISASTLIV